ncbi:MAG: betaine/proline/choline family ABC transporter ATP-binding protein [Bacillota bacterium]|nr:betaine/proline/choline family ABC transporter ATP-binding protein [Bacillota bacterium]
MDNPQTLIVQIANLWKVFSASHTIDVMDQEAVEKAEDHGAIAAVRDVSFDINRGEVFVIMGLSGSGKSSLIRCLPRLVDPDDGKMIIAGEDVMGMNEAELIEFRRNKVAMVFQHYGLMPHRTVLENVAFGLKLKGIERLQRRNKACEVIEQVGLKGWEKHYPSQLSGGMQQRVGIARALIQDTDLLLMDEPFSGLDPLIRREMQDELVKLQKDLHKTIVFVTHDLNEAFFLGDHMAVMQKGSFVQIGTPQEIVSNPADEYVRRFVHDERRVALMVEGGRNQTSSTVHVVNDKRPKLKKAAVGGE